MIRLAVLAYYFPPLGGGGTPRTVKFVKFLPREGIRPIVVTSDPVAEAFQREFQRDDGPLEELCRDDYELLRVPDPGERGFRKSLRGSRLFPALWATGYRWLYESQRAWSFAAARALLTSPLADGVDAVYVSAAPFSALEAGRWLARRLGVPWIADLRDLWTRDTKLTYPSKVHFDWASRLERSLLEDADAVIANTPTSGRRIRDWLRGDAPQRVSVIPNGFDRDDLAGARAGGGRLPGDLVTLLHAGTLYSPEIRRSRLGRYFPLPIDDSARSILPMARGLAALRGTDPGLASRLRIRLLGHDQGDSQAIVRALGLESQFTFEGTVSRAAALQASRDADALLTIHTAWADTERPLPYVPGKTYESIAARVPLLAPVGSGDLRDLLLRVPQAYVSDFRDPNGTSEAIRRLLSDVLAGVRYPADPEWLNSFERRELTSRLSGVVRDVLASPRSR